MARFRKTFAKSRNGLELSIECVESAPIRSSSQPRTPMTLTQLRAKMQKSFRNDSERLWWMNAVNRLLAKDPNFFNPKPVSSPEAVRLQATKVLPPSTSKNALPKPIVECPICHVKLVHLQKHLKKVHSGLPRKRKRRKYNARNPSISCSDGSTRPRCRDCGGIAVVGSDRCYSCGG